MRPELKSCWAFVVSECRLISSPTRTETTKLLSTQGFHTVTTRVGADTMMLFTIFFIIFAAVLVASLKLL
jgi:hypothetical protein